MQSRIGMGYAGPPAGLEPGTHCGEYSEEWAELRRLRRRGLIGVAGGVAIYGCFLPVAKFALWLGFALFVAWAVALGTLFWALMKIAYWLCPRCGKEFHGRRGTFNRMSNPFARRCVHCGLPKWADPDPGL